MINHVFNRFNVIWGAKWTNKIDGLEKDAKEIWAQAIVGMTQKQIDAGIKNCARELVWPPEIAEFVKACLLDKNAQIPVGMTPAKAMELAEKTLRNRFIPKNYDDVIAEREALAALQDKIFRDQNDTADISFCASNDCRKFIIARDQLIWHCDKHSKNNAQ